MGTMLLTDVVTVRFVEAEKLPDEADINDVPMATPAASPLEQAALLMVATDVLDELHVTTEVTTCVVLSENVPVAVNCSVDPAVMLGLAGCTAREASVAEETVRVVEPDMLPTAAVIVVAPAARAVAWTVEQAVLLIVATVSEEELQTADAVRSRVELLE